MDFRRLIPLSLFLAAGLPLAGCGRGEDDARMANRSVDAPRKTDPAVATNSAALEEPTGEEAGVAAAALLPPRAQEVSAAPVEGATTLAFRSPEPPRAVVHWYRSARNAGSFQLASELDEGGEHVLSGTVAGRKTGDFSVRLTPDERGGTTAVVLITKRR